jgi:L-alanine-DL-glutamate epimerase-like enolase superfamily enzyme
VIRIDGYELWKLRVPMGRTIGDCGCAYDAMAVVALALKSTSGAVGWGFGETPWGGRFARGADWLRPMPPIAALIERFEQRLWTKLFRSPADMFSPSRDREIAGGDYLEQAVRMALWDLSAKEHDMPLHRLIRVGSREGPRVRAYASGLEFNSTDAEAAALHREFVARGFAAVKVKVGHTDIEHDLRRLRAVRGAIGPTVELAIDANEAWDCDQAVARVTKFENEGLRLSYVEDPLPRNDVAGTARLRRSIAIDVVGHDYIGSAAEMRPFLEQGALMRVRLPSDIDEALAVAELARSFGLKVIIGNTFLETGVHVAAALGDLVDRMEFSALSWNQLVDVPVAFDNGFALVPDRPGHGLDPKIDRLDMLASAGESPAPTIVGERLTHA